MRTAKGKNITKKEIQRILRTEDATQIFRLHYLIYGNVNRINIYRFIKQYAPSAGLRASARRIAYNMKNDDYRQRIDDEVIRRHGIYHGNDLISLIDYVKRQCADPGSFYAKRPMMGYTHLYFCSPIYGHSDYNKVRSIPIAGNERLCDAIIKYADRYFTPIYGK